jgi:hypothetical protein
MANHHKTLHILQGGVQNGDKRWLETAARRGAGRKRWVVPKSATVGDDVIIYIGGHGLFATATIASSPKPRRDWPNRYGAAISSVRLIKPPISLAVLQQYAPKLAWTTYPRSITTPLPAVAERLRALIAKRRRHRGTELDLKLLEEASLEELRGLALLKASPRATATERRVIQRKRIQVVRVYALKRAKGRCEFCKDEAPFRTVHGAPYLESHHITQLSDEGADRLDNVIGVCPNCHRRAHYAHERLNIKVRMKRRVAAIERKRRQG